MAAELAQRVARLEAIEAIKQLKTRYAQICDAGYSPDDVAELFTDDAVWDGGEELGRHEGIEAIRRFFAETKISWALHYIVAPAVEVADDLQTAEGTWYLWQPCTIPGEDGDNAVWIMARYRDRLRQQDGAWRFSEMLVDTQAATPADETWVTRRFL